MWFGKSGRNYHPRAVAGFADDNRLPPAGYSDRTVGRAKHDLRELQFDPARRGFDVDISGHSHQSRIEIIDKLLYLNPGSAGPRRFKLPVTLATLELTARGLQPITMGIQMHNASFEGASTVD
jgi:hypothetical protein